MTAPHTGAHGVRGLTYDSGALIAAEKDDRRFWVLHREALRAGVRPTVPTVVLAETYRGENWLAGELLRFCRIESLHEGEAKAAGRRRSRAPGASAVDAVCVEGALSRGDACVTSDAGDLRALAEVDGSQIEIIEV